MTSFIAGTATLVFSAYHFQQTAPLGVVGNVLVLPLVSLVIMPFAVLSVLMMPLGLEAPFVSIMGWGIDRMVDCAALVAGWSNGFTGNPLLTSSALLLSLGALAWFAYFQNWWRLIGPALAVPLILCTRQPARHSYRGQHPSRSGACRYRAGACDGADRKRRSRRLVRALPRRNRSECRRDHLRQPGLHRSNAALHGGCRQERSSIAR